MSKLPPGTQIDDNLLSLATSMQMVESIALLSHAPDTKFVGINMYVDDAGSLRGAARNLRATEIAHCCGQPIEVRGDTYLARVLDNGDDFERLDFALSEMSSEADWVKAAARQAAARRERESAETVMKRMQSGGGGSKKKTAQVRELTPAEAAKEEGNVVFKRGDWEAAARHYSTAIELEPQWVPALNNRAMTLLRLERWAQALADCETVLALQPANVKALLRAAAAEKELGRRAEARARLEAALAAEPNNKEAQQRLAELTAADAA